MRPPALITVAVAAAVSLLATAPLRGEVADPIEVCKATSSDTAAEVECLRGVIRDLLDLDAAVPDSADAGLSADSPTHPAPEEAASPPAAIPAAPVATDAVAGEAPAEPTGIGAEQVAAKQDRKSDSKRKDKEVDALVVDFAYTSLGKLVLVLDNGQVWAQRGGDTREVRLREGEHTPVVIKRGMLSGYRIQFTEKRRTISAERLR